MSVGSAFPNEPWLTSVESKCDGGRLNGFQLDLQFFAFKIREASKMTQDLIIGSFALSSRTKISILIEHHGGESDELMSV